MHLALSVLITAAIAGDCPWAGADKVTATATRTTVMVNGSTYPVDSSAAVAQFATTLNACNAQAAVPELNQWRNLKLFAWGSFGVGMLLAGIGCCVAPFPAYLARQHRDAMVAAINASTPPR